MLRRLVPVSGRDGTPDVLEGTRALRDRRLGWPDAKGNLPLGATPALLGVLLPLVEQHLRRES